DLLLCPSCPDRDCFSSLLSPGSPRCGCRSHDCAALRVIAFPRSGESNLVPDILLFGTDRVSRSSSPQMFDEHDFVAILVVNEGVEDLVGELDSESAGADSVLDALRDAGQGIFRSALGISNCCGAEAGSRIADVVENHAVGAQEANIHLQRRI